MSVILGTNCGFVSEAPVNDPTGSATTTDGYARAMKHASPIGAGRITEIGWWCDTFSNEQNFEVGLYSHDAGNDKPGNRLYVDATNAKGTTSGWKTVAVDWEITAETIYWIAFQLDPVTGDTKTDQTVAGAPSRASFVAASTLLATWPASNELGRNIAVYALYEAAVSYADLAGTGGGIGGGSGILAVEAYIALAGTGGGTGDGSAALLVSGFPSGTSGASVYKRLVVAGNDKIYYEDI